MPTQLHQQVCVFLEHPPSDSPTSERPTAGPGLSKETRHRAAWCQGRTGTPVSPFTGTAHTRFEGMCSRSVHRLFTSDPSGRVGNDATAVRPVGRRSASSSDMEHAVPQHRQDLAVRAARFLPPGSVIRQVFGAQCFTPWLVGPLLVLYAPFMTWRLVAVADEGIFILSASNWFLWHPKRVLLVLPRRTELGPVGGLWSRIQLGSERAWVNWRFFSDLRAADAEIARIPAEGDMAPVMVPRPPTPVERLFHTPLSWRLLPGKPDGFVVDHDGARWELHDDSSNQGPRYVVSTDGRVARETQDLPAGWVLPRQERHGSGNIG
jgi:hypothetical protein